eukprot:COSAG01_NODE_962_length_12418_cov_57.124492_4_plen_226_part_00
MNYESMHFCFGIRCACCLPAAAAAAAAASFARHYAGLIPHMSAARQHEHTSAQKDGDEPPPRDAEHTDVPQTTCFNAQLPVPDERKAQENGPRGFCPFVPDVAHKTHAHAPLVTQVWLLPGAMPTCSLACSAAEPVVSSKATLPTPPPSSATAAAPDRPAVPRNPRGRILWLLLCSNSPAASHQPTLEACWEASTLSPGTLTLPPGRLPRCGSSDTSFISPTAAP